MGAPGTMSEEEWERAIRAFIRQRMAQQGVSYGDLAARLGNAGVQVTRQVLTNKLNRPNGFAASFLMQVVAALDVSGFPEEVAACLQDGDGPG